MTKRIAARTKIAVLALLALVFFGVAAYAWSDRLATT
jgi:hypothetical protein